jgi:hypothetical protein
MNDFDFEIKIKEKEDFEIISDLLDLNDIEFKKWKEKNYESYLLTFLQPDPNDDLAQSIYDCFECYEQTSNIPLGQTDIKISIQVTSSISNFDQSYFKTTYLIYNPLLSDRPKKKIEKKEPIELESIHIKIKDKKVKFLIGASVEVNKQNDKKEYYPFIFPSSPNKYLRFGRQLSNRCHNTREEATSEAKILAEEYILYQVELRNKTHGTK